MTPKKTNNNPPAVVHVDLDGASAIYTVHGWPYPHQSDPLFESGMNNLLALLDEFNIKATLFVIAGDLDNPRKREILQKAVERGHEIGCHSFSHRKLTTLSREEQIHEINASREHISASLNVPVDGFRAPYFDIDRDSHLLVAQAGYKYDSSLFPGKRKRPGNSQIESGQTPRNLWSEHAMLELPLPAYTPLPFPFHASYSLVFGFWYFKFGLNRFRQSNAPLVLLFHLTDLSDPLPANMRNDWKQSFFTLSHLGGARKRANCARMLRYVAQKYQITNTTALLSELASTRQNSERKAS